MISKIKTVSFQGIDIIPITVEVSITNGLPQFNIVGLADKSVAKSKDGSHSRSAGILPVRIFVHLHEKGNVCPFSCGSEAA